MGVSKNGGTPKWMVYNGKPYFLMDDLGVPHYFWKHPYEKHSSQIFTLLLGGCQPNLQLFSMHEEVSRCQVLSNPIETYDRQLGSFGVKIKLFDTTTYSSIQTQQCHFRPYSNNFVVLWPVNLTLRYPT